MDNVTASVSLTASTLKDLDNGIFGLLVDKEINVIAKDLDDRGGQDEKARHLCIDVEFIKVNGVLTITPKVQCKLPPRVSHSTHAKERMRSKDQTEILFQPLNRDNADQGTLPLSDDNDNNAE